MNSKDMSQLERLVQIQRRTFLRGSGYGLGAIAAGALLGPDAAQAARAVNGMTDGRWTGVVKKPHFPVQAKRVIHVFRAGGPSKFEPFAWTP